MKSCIAVGNYFGKGVKIGALTALLATATGCTPTTGPELTPDYNEPTAPTQPVTPDTQSIFDLPNFAEGVDGFAVGNGYNDSAAFQVPYTKAAGAYLLNKSAALRNQIQNAGESALKRTLDNSLESVYLLSENLQTLNNSLPEYYNSTAEYMAQIINNLDPKDQATFRACYDHLAAQSYVNSLTVKKNSHAYPTLVTVQKDIPEIAAELRDLGIADNAVEKTLQGLITTVANQNNIAPTTLQDCVNLALNIDGVYGLNDSIMIQGGGVPASVKGLTSWVSFGGVKNALPPPPPRAILTIPRNGLGETDARCPCLTTG